MWSTWSIILFGLALLATCSHGFVPPISGALSSRFRDAAHVLFYTNDPPEHQQQQPVRRVLTIPVLSPIPGKPPLVIGEDYVLEHPTPMQWQVLEEAMHNHRQYLKEEQSSNRVVTAGIDAAPLVAFMDDVTSLAPIRGDKKNSKYATIAAVVGISSSTNSKDNNLNGIDTSSSTSFMESIMRVFQPDNSNKGAMIRPSESTIRLVGIGRAALSDFHSRLPSTYYEHHEDEDDEDAYHSNVHKPEQEDDVKTPLLMAQFRLLTDTGERSSDYVNEFGRSGNSSPMHALAEMSSLASRITSLHEDRKKLVRGLQAAKARLTVASQATVLEDHDGLGMLSSGFSLDNDNPQTQEDIATLLSDFPDTAQPPPSLFNTDNSCARLLELENYGMGISSASFAAIPGLTAALAEKLQPYYSSEKQDTEEHYYETFSFMGVLSLNKFVAATDLDWALKCTNTIERMQWIYESMWSHKKILRQASEEVSQELRDCGEECTDLW